MSNREYFKDLVQRYGTIILKCLLVHIAFLMIVLLSFALAEMAKLVDVKTAVYYQTPLILGITLAFPFSAAILCFLEAKRALKEVAEHLGKFAS